MKKYFPIAIFCLSSCLSYGDVIKTSSPLQPPSTNAIPINHIVAVVNNEIITQVELNIALKNARAQAMQQQVIIPNEKEFKEKILEGLIYQKLQLQIAKQNKITASDKQLAAAIASIAAQNHITVNDLKSRLQLEGIPFGTFKQQIKEQIIVNTMQQQAISGKIQITDKQLQEFKDRLAKKTTVKQYNVLDFLIPFTSNSSNNKQKLHAKNTAQEVVKALKTKHKLPNSVQQNNFDFQPLNAFPDLFAQRLKKMNIGNISEPILAGNGYHVLQLVATKSKSTTITNQQAKELLYQEKYQKELQKWLQQLKKNSYIKILSE